MTRIPSLTGKKLVATLKRFGFEVIRVKGSHHYPTCAIRTVGQQWFPYMPARLLAAAFWPRFSGTPSLMPKRFSPSCNLGSNYALQIDASCGRAPERERYAA